MAWMLMEGLYPQKPQTWQIVTHPERRDAWARQLTTAHATPICPEIKGRDTETTQLTAEEVLTHSLCETCWSAHLHGQRTFEDQKAIVREAHGLHRIATWAELVDSSDHVLIGRNSRALHAAVVKDVTEYLEHQLNAGVNEELRVMHERVAAICDAVKQRYTYSPEKVLLDAMLIAVKHHVRQGLGNQLYPYALGESYNKVQELFSEWLENTGDLDEGLHELDLLLSEEKAQQLLANKVPLAEIAATWKQRYTETCSMTEPSYYIASGLPSSLHSVPRGCRDHLIGYGLRGRDVVWGIGVLPRIVVEWLSASKAERDTKVSPIDIPYQGEIEKDAAETALFLMREAQGGKSETYRKVEDALQAAILL